MNCQVVNFQRCECAQRNDKERQEEGASSEELKRFKIQKMTRGFFFFFFNLQRHC